ncbi:hypothetical protein D9756_000734 [Leucocoprinus leucothites]|uniref:Uncharacterized protein n=1 Tax=Leucocoprinus leucothites TaxID=201217 RepID=A0A8H5GFT8_9AGAR|nr:hypothetical protein D9756_000734 [Leucoagaricus leucothites]
MKSVAFFRNTWRKRNKGKDTTEGKQDMSTTKRVVLVPESAPCTPTAMTFEIPMARLSPSPDRRMRSQSEDSFAFQVSSAFGRKASSPPSSSSSTCSLVDHETATYPSIPDHHDGIHSPRSPVVWKSSHGPPKNTFHGPPNLNLYSPMSGTSPRSVGGTPPVRPPRPPPLNLYTTTAKRPVNTGIPPRFTGNRAITFALPPNPRAIKTVELASTTSGSSSDSPPLSEDHEERASRSSEETARCACTAISPDGSHVYPHRSALRIKHAAANPPLPSTVGSPSHISSPRTVQAVLDLSDTPRPRRIYQSGELTSSTPHLPPRDEQEVPPVPPLPFKSFNGQADDVLDFPLSLFPAPPQSPLFIRRKVAKNLVLRPSLTTPGTPLLPSSSLGSPNYTPLVTPTTPRLQPSTINHSKSFSNLPRYPSPRTVPPPLFDPPSTPLPTPPASPAIPTVMGDQPSSPPLRYLRSVRSVNQLHSEQLLPPLLPLTHRTSSSEPGKVQQDDAIAVNRARRPVRSRVEVTH